MFRVRVVSRRGFGGGGHFFHFLRNLPATIIPSLAVPLSLLGTLAVMYLCSASAWTICSLMALTISTGVRGRRLRHRHDRKYFPICRSPATSHAPAALKGSQQIGFTIISLTVLLIAVLIPLRCSSGDVVGRLFHEFAITLSVTIVISAVVSLTPGADDKVREAGTAIGRRRSAHSVLTSLPERGFNWIIGRYDRALTVVLEGISR